MEYFLLKLKSSKNLDETTEKNKSKIFKTSKVYCFLTYYPLVKFYNEIFHDILSMLFFIFLFIIKRNDKIISFTKFIWVNNINN